MNRDVSQDGVCPTSDLVVLLLNNAVGTNFQLYLTLGLSKFNRNPGNVYITDDKCIDAFKATIGGFVFYVQAEHITRPELNAIILKLPSL